MMVTVRSSPGRVTTLVTGVGDHVDVSELEEVDDVVSVDTVKVADSVIDEAVAMRVAEPGDSGMEVTVSSGGSGICHVQVSH